MTHDELIEDLEQNEWYCEDSFDRILSLIQKLHNAQVSQDIINDVILETIAVMREEYGD